MENRVSKLLNTVLWVQLMCFITAVSFVAGGGQNADIANTYNGFVYLKALFLVFPILVSMVLSSVSFFHFFNPFKDILKQHWALLIYFVFAYISIIFAYDQVFSLGRLIYTSGAVLSLWCLMAQYQMMAGSALKALIYRHLLSVFVVMIVGIPALAIILSGFADLRGAIQMTGLIHPNTVASVCAYALFHALFYSSPRSLWSTYARWFVSAGALILITMIFSRSVIVALVMSLLITGWFAFIWFRSFKALGVVAGVSLMGVVGLLLMSLRVIPIAGIISSISRTGDGMDLLTLTHRTELWHRLIETVDLKIAMLGNGYGVMTEGFGVDFGTGIIYGAHNVYLSIFLGTGVFSFIAFMAYLASIFFKIRKNHNDLGMKASLHGIALLSFFMIHSMTSTEFSLNLSVSFALVMIMAALVLKQEGRRS